MSEKFDVVITGGTIMGSSTAYHLAADPGFTCRVLVVEKDMTYAKSATALSLSSIRQQFSSPINIRVGLAGVAFLRELKQKLEVDGERPDVPFTENGYLYLASEAGAQTLRDNHVVQAREGAEIALLSPGEIEARYPYLSADGVALGALGLRNEGWFDSYQLLQAFRRKARSLGVLYREEKVVEVEREGSRVTAVRLGGGERVACGAFVDTAGASGAAEIARGSGSKSRCARASAASSCSRPSRAGWIARSSSIRTASFFARKGSPSSRGSRRPRPRTPTATISR